MCNELEIDEQELFDIDKTIHTKESDNPFETKTLYVYYNGFYPTHKNLINVNLK